DNGPPPPESGRCLCGGGGGLLGRQRLVDQHHGDAVADRVVPLALAAHQVVALTRDRVLVQRTRQDRQQLGIHVAAELRGLICRRRSITSRPLVSSALRRR